MVSNHTYNPVVNGIIPRIGHFLEKTGLAPSCDPWDGPSRHFLTLFEIQSQLLWSASWFSKVFHSQTSIHHAATSFHGHRDSCGSKCRRHGVPFRLFRRGWLAGHLVLHQCCWVDLKNWWDGVPRTSYWGCYWGPLNPTNPETKSNKVQQTTLSRGQDTKKS